MTSIGIDGRDVFGLRPGWVLRQDARQQDQAGYLDISRH